MKVTVSRMAKRTHDMALAAPIRNSSQAAE